MGAQTVRTVTPLSKCWATWCFFPAQTSATREKPPNSWSSPYVSHLKPARITVYLPSVSGQEGQRVRRAEQGTNKGNQKPTKLFVRQHWPQTEIFHTKEALHRTATFIKKKAILPQRFVSSPWRERPTKIQELPTAVLPCLLKIGSTQRRTLYISRHSCPF